MSGGLPAATSARMVPCTPAGCMILLKRARAGHDLAGQDRRWSIGRSNLVGKPMAQLLLAENCTVTIAHSRTRDLAGDGARRPTSWWPPSAGRNWCAASWIKPGAVVIDVGMNRIPAPERGEGKTRLVGDVAYAEAAAVAGGDHAGAGRRRPDDHRHADGQHADRGLRQRRPAASGPSRSEQKKRRRWRLLSFLVRLGLWREPCQISSTWRPTPLTSPGQTSALRRVVRVGRRDRRDRTAAAGSGHRRLRRRVIVRVDNRHGRNVHPMKLADLVGRERLRLCRRSVVRIIGAGQSRTRAEAKRHRRDCCQM